jgi:uncharacterized protein DUF5658
MTRHRNRVFLGLTICAALLPGGVRVEGSEAPDDQEVIRSEAIDSGYVILDGRYLSPPYLLEKHADDLWVNDQLAAADWFLRQAATRGRGGSGGRGRHGEGPGFGGPRGRRMPPSEPRFGLRQLESTLNDNGMLIAGEGLRGISLSETNAAMVVDALMSGKSHEEKLRLIREDVPFRVEEVGWLHLIETFEPSDELIGRIGPEIERVQQAILENEANHQAALASAFWDSQPVKYVITLLAMGLVVAACGTLLNYRPIGRARWSEVDATGDGIAIVVRSVVLLVLLGIFDLGCTLVAQQAGGFTEMNPLGSRLIENPALLTVFKVTSLLLACGILFALRRYRGAQLASWWMCLLCTVLTFRWLTYNSMFM